jgi:hypothetical protein
MCQRLCEFRPLTTVSTWQEGPVRSLSCVQRVIDFDPKGDYVKAVALPFVVGVAIGVVVFIAFLLFFLVSCCCKMCSSKRGCCQRAVPKAYKLRVPYILLVVALAIVGIVGAVMIIRSGPETAKALGRLVTGLLEKVCPSPATNAPLPSNHALSSNELSSRGVVSVNLIDDIRTDQHIRAGHWGDRSHHIAHYLLLPCIHLTPVGPSKQAGTTKHALDNTTWTFAATNLPCLHALLACMHCQKHPVAPTCRDAVLPGSSTCAQCKKSPIKVMHQGRMQIDGGLFAV